MNIITPRNRNKPALWKYIAQTEGITGHRLPRRAVLNTLARWLFLLGIVGLTALCWMALTSSVAAKTEPSISLNPAVKAEKAISTQPAPKVTPTAKNEPLASDKQAIKTLILAEMTKAGYRAPNFALRVAICESGLRKDALGDGHYRSRGIWQISAHHHPDVSDACAFDPVCSTQWAAKQFAAGRASLWTCARLLAAS